MANTLSLGMYFRHDNHYSMNKKVELQFEFICLNNNLGDFTEIIKIYSLRTHSTALLPVNPGGQVHDLK